MRCSQNLFRTLDGGRVLDAACGSGRFTRLLANELQTIRSVVGIDSNKDSIDQARRDTDDRRISYRLLSLEDLPETPARYDTAAIAYALHHVADPAGVLRRLVSVLNPGGALIVNEAFSDGLTPSQENGRDIHHLKAWVDRSRGIEHRETFTAEQVRRLIRGCGVVPVAECVESPDDERASDDGRSPDERTRDALSFLNEYSEFAAEGEDERFRSLRLDLERRIREAGVASPPHLIILARKSAVGD